MEERIVFKKKKGSQNLVDFTRRRNLRVMDIYRNALGIDVQVIGDPQNPAIVYPFKCCISCFVKNFDLILTSVPHNGEHVDIIKLNLKNINDPEMLNKVRNHFETCKHRPIHMIRIKSTTLYLGGYNYTDKENSLGRYPVYVEKNPKVYFEKAYAMEVVETLKEETVYDLEVFSPYDA